MQLEHEFHVQAPPQRVWSVLTDLERVATCMPGARLEGRQGEDYTGRVKVKIGAVVAEFQGVARFVEYDEAAQAFSVRAEGRDVRGQSSASATVRAAVAAQGQGAQVSVTTSLDTAGKIAQFGRAIMNEVSEALLKEFVARLSQLLEQEGPASAGPAPAEAASGTAAGTAAGPGPEPAPAKAATARDEQDEVLDLGAVGGAALVRRFAPVGAAVLAAALTGFVVGRATRRRTGTARAPQQAAPGVLLVRESGPGVLFGQWQDQ